MSEVESARERRPALGREHALRALLHEPVEALYEGNRRLVSCSDSNALAECVQTAFIEHRPLILSPDVVWQCLAQGFAAHVNEHAAALRERFVRHSGRLTLQIERRDFALGQPNPWPEVFGAFSEQIGAHLGGLRELVVADFSTTGPVERVASEVTLPDGFQAYFEYKFTIGCGIPTVTLLGAPSDWRSIRARAAQLAEFELGWWTGSLLPVLDQFVVATGREHALRVVAGLFGVVEDEASGALSPEMGGAVLHGHGLGERWSWRDHSQFETL